MIRFAAALTIAAAASGASAQQGSDILPTRPLDSLDGEFRRADDGLSGLTPPRPDIPAASGAGQLLLQDARVGIPGGFLSLPVDI